MRMQRKECSPITAEAMLSFELRLLKVEYFFLYKQSDLPLTYLSQNKVYFFSV